VTVSLFEAVAGDTIVDLATFSVHEPVNGSRSCATTITVTITTSVVPAASTRLIVGLLSRAQ
jgi:hypothetical protein